MITLSKIAKLANVSVSTASKAFAGSAEVNAETRELIFNVAREHGCFKKYYNVQYPKLVIAVIAPEFSSGYYTKYLSCIQKYLEDANCELCVSTTEFSIKREKALVEYYYKHSSVDGIIIINSLLDSFNELEIPVVFINPKNKFNNCCTIVNNTKTAYFEAIDYLAHKGVCEIGFVGESLTIRKHELFKEILLSKGLCYNPEFIGIVPERFETGGYLAMEKILSCGKVPRAVICAYDYMAIGAVKCIYDKGLNVPDDIAVIGSDNIREDEFMIPPLASISTNIEQLCRLGSDVIIKQITSEKYEFKKELISEFIPRQSCFIK